MNVSNTRYSTHNHALYLAGNGPHCLWLGWYAGGVYYLSPTCLLDSGFTSALIRKTDRTESDLVTAFYYNIGMAALCYLALYVSAPFVADFYQQQELQTLLRVLGLTCADKLIHVNPRVNPTC